MLVRLIRGIEQVMEEINSLLMELSNPSFYREVAEEYKRRALKAVDDALSQLDYLGLLGAGLPFPIASALLPKLLTLMAYSLDPPKDYSV